MKKNVLYIYINSKILKKKKRKIVATPNISKMNNKHTYSENYRISTSTRRQIPKLVKITLHNKHCSENYDDVSKEYKTKNL